MSLIAHLVRATLSPERAVRPLLPQAYANWRGDNAEWEDAIEPVGEGAPAVVAASGPVRRAEAVLEPADAPASPRRAARVERRAEAAAVAPTPKSPPLPAAPVVEMPPEVVDATAQQAPRRAPRPAAAAHQPEVAPVAVVPDGAARVADRPVLETPAASRHGAADTVLGRGAPRHRVGLEHALEAPAPRAPIADLRRVAMPDIPLSKPDQNEAVVTPLLLEPLSTPREVGTRQGADVPKSDPANPGRGARVRGDDTPIAETPRAPAAASSPTAAPLLVAPQAPPAEPAASAQRAPDVHISIGRVEVRAAAAPPPAKRAEAARAEPLSLEAYLARRNGSAK